MQSVGSFFSTVSKFYNELNPATLSGAIDVVVVEQADGELACSPFHVRFGKLSILRPQEKVVEVTINGRVVDFPMKVGDAGEAFFVFETEQDVPEEFATSPLARPTTDKVEEDIDYLDLAQGTSTMTHPPDDITLDAGYVSAHSGHGSEFEEDERADLSPELRKKSDYASAVKYGGTKGQGRYPGSSNEAVTSVHAFMERRVHRWSLTMSLPPSPVLKARDIMENFQPIDSAGPFNDSGENVEHLLVPKPISTNRGGNSGILTHPQDDMIMDMTGYKTEDSAEETDLDSHASGEHEAGTAGAMNGRHRRKRVAQRKKRGSLHGVNSQDRLVAETPYTTAHVPSSLDPRLPSRPAARPVLRPKSYTGLGTLPNRRSSSMPNLKYLGQNDTLSPNTPAIFQRFPSKNLSSMFSIRGEFKDESSSGSSVASSPPPQVINQQSPKSRHRHHRHHQEHTDGAHPRRHSHKPSQQVQVKKPPPRSNPAVNALSDTELEYQTPRTTAAAQESEWSWGWGSLPVKNDGLGTGEADQKEHRSSHLSIDIPGQRKPVLNDMEIDGTIYRLAISLCPGDEFGKDLEASEALFAANQVSFDEFARDPLKILNNKNLVCLINDRYFTWTVAGPYLSSLMLFRKPLSDETLHQLSAKDPRHLSDRLSVQDDPPTRFGALSRWLRGSQTSSQLSATEQGQRQRSSSINDALQPVQVEATQVLQGVRVESMKDTALRQPEEARYESSVRELELMTRSTSLPINEGIAGSISDQYAGDPQPTHSVHKSSRRYAKTLRLTSEQLKSLSLKKGANTLTFSVTSSYQGKAVCSAKLFLWDHDYQVVISDIDGTITKSDALGHIFTMAGKDWTHSGVAKLYTDIVNNGYHILYLTSRAIGQADYTRKYLKNVEQNNYQLPDGPVIMSPDRLMTAFHREVIMRKPEEFKMACLRDIRRVFGDRNPFYAGFGNRITDALSYRSVNVPSSRIFTIDSGGEVKLELLSSYKSSYLALNDLVNEIFPGKRQAPEFNDWNFWRAPLPSIELPIAPSQQYTPAAVPGDYNAQGYAAGSNRLGVIRSLTSSLTSAGPLKARSAIPTFASSLPTAPNSYPSAMKPHSPHQSQLASSPPPPASAPSGLQIADRTRRLSLSLMRYSSQPAPSSAPALKPLTDSPESNVGIGNGDAGAVFDGNHAALGPNGSSPLRSNSDGAYPVDAPVEKRKVSGFSVSPPQLASRLSETVMPFLRRRASKLEQEQEEGQGQKQAQEQEQEREHEVQLGAASEGDQHVYSREYKEEEAAVGYLEDHHELGEFEDEEGEGAEGYAGYYGEEEDGLEEDQLEGEEHEDEDDDDVELNIDAPFL
ncbi:hypothetical protein KVV02_004946 [Mortierella alpina]|uniref:phosphatidate phosphatase n=1 Tax=Mortierella alpina TaxID=64518 RepID=A0A9P8CZD3_MORAP|nr:hypothetical protein KVV02_004946 [Mortierella alpina]